MTSHGIARTLARPALGTAALIAGAAMDISAFARTKKAGYDVLLVKVSPDGKEAKIEPFMTGFLDESANTFWGRPVDVLVMPDGAVLISDEQNGAIYRVSSSR